MVLNAFPINGDIELGAEDVMHWLYGRTSGVFAGANNLKVTASGMGVSVSDGVGWITDADGRGCSFWHRTDKDGVLTLPIDTNNTGYSRIDRIVVRWNTTDYISHPEIVVLKGTASRNPSAPSITRTTIIREISLAAVTVKPGAISISNNDITDERMKQDVCGLVSAGVEIDTSSINAQASALLDAIASELQEVNDGSAYEFRRNRVTGISVAASDFTLDSTYNSFPYRAAIEIDNTTSDMDADVTFSVFDATSGNFAPVCETYNGGVYIYAKKAPSSNVIIPKVTVRR